MLQRGSAQCYPHSIDPAAGSLDLPKKTDLVLAAHESPCERARASPVTRWAIGPRSSICPALLCPESRRPNPTSLFGEGVAAMIASGGQEGLSAHEPFCCWFEVAVNSIYALTDVRTTLHKLCDGPNSAGLLWLHSFELKHNRSHPVGATGDYHALFLFALLHPNRTSAQ